MMIEHTPDDGMIEIGDVEDEPTAGPEPTPQVVIEYRDRGVPWMLVPPLLALVAVMAGVGAYNYTSRLKERRPSPVVSPNPAAEADPTLDPPSSAPLPAPDQPEGSPSSASSPQIVENPALAPPIQPAAEPLGQPALRAVNPPGLDLPEAGEAPPVAMPAAPPVPVGFDPGAFDTPAAVGDDNGPARVDQNLAPVARNGQADELPVAAANVDQPEMVDPDLLPPDPRKARAERHRRAVEAQARAEAERFEFYTHLYRIYKKNGPNTVQLAQELCKAYGQDVPPAAKDQALKYLGKTGAYAGASTAGRINILRKLGFPESVILGDIYDMESRHESTEGRNAPSRGAVYLRSIRTLLSYPPGRPAGTNRPVPPPREDARSQPRAADPAGTFAPDLDQR